MGDWPCDSDLLAGPVRFELTMGFPTPVFKTGAFNHSATDPWEAADDITKPGGINSLILSGFIETFRSLR
jgi:hypothetical protein